MSKETMRPGWHGHSRTIAQICGCSTTTVSKILNGKAEEIGANKELVKRVKETAAQMIIRDKLILLRQAEEKQRVADALTA